MPHEFGLLSLAGKLIGFVGVKVFRRHDLQKWVGEWNAHVLVGRNLGGPMALSGPTKVELEVCLPFTLKLAYECYETNAKGQPTRYQRGYIHVDENDPRCAKRSGHYLDSDEWYEYQMRMPDDDTVILTPIPGSSTLPNAYTAHGWKRKK